MNQLVFSPIRIGYKVINAKMMPMFWWHKGQLPQYNKVSTNFSLHEFECPCDSPHCDLNFMSIPFIYKLQEMRDALQERIKVTSGYRCSFYQEELKRRGYKTARKLSQHQLGNAADIMCDDHEFLKKAAPTFFKAIGTAKDWMHVDGRTDKVRAWGY